MGPDLLRVSVVSVYGYQVEMLEVGLLVSTLSEIRGIAENMYGIDVRLVWRAEEQSTW